MFRRFATKRTLILLAIVAAVVLAILLGVRIFAHAKTIEIVGCSVYDADAVAAASGISPSDRMYGLDADALLATLQKEFPAIRGLKLRHKPFSGTVVLEIDEASVSYCATLYGECLWLSDTLTVLRRADAPREGTPTIVLPDLLSAVVGAPLHFRDHPDTDWMLEFLRTVQSGALAGTITEFDLSEKFALSVTRADGVNIRFGSRTDLPEKCALADRILRELGAEQVAEIDVSTPTAPYVTRRSA